MMTKRNIFALAWLGLFAGFVWWFVIDTARLKAEQDDRCAVEGKVGYISRFGSGCYDLDPTGKGLGDGQENRIR